MSNSPLVSYTCISPNKTVGRKHAIDWITPHCVVGQCSVETLGNIFAPTTRQASSNYGIGADGRVGMYCEEKDRSWCTSSSANDNRAVTIECASDASAPYAFKDVVYNKLIELCVDICKRNGKTKLLWFGDKNKTLNYNPASDEMVLTVHRWYANKSCPGDWMYARMGDLAEKVTAQLCGVSSPEVKGRYIKGVAIQLSTNFKSTEFDCHGNGCCTETWVDPELVKLLQKIRDHFGKPIKITSGYRCPIHNSKVSRAKNSYHTKGMAADFIVEGVAPREVAKYCESIGIKGIGLYETDRDGHFVHIDVRAVKAFWYGQAEAPVDTFGGSKAEDLVESTPAVLYRVQVGAYSFVANARQMQKRIKAAGFDTYLVKADDGLYKVQVGAFAKYENAEKQVAKVKAAGFSCFITTKSGTPVGDTEDEPKPTIKLTGKASTSADVKAIITYLKAKGFGVFGVYGVLANLIHESNLKSSNLQNNGNNALDMTDEEYTAAVDNGSYTKFVNDSYGYGLCQWTYHTRKKALLEFAQSNNKTVADWIMQIDFMCKELEGYPKLLQVLKTATSVREASDAFMCQFERPADQSEAAKSKRAKTGEEYYNKYEVKSEPKVEAVAVLKEGDKVKLTKDATVYGTTGTFKSWVYNSILYVREVNGDRVVVSTVKTGPVTGAVHKKHLTKI